MEINQNGNNLKIKQKRYLLEPNSKFSKGLWSIPLSLGLEKEISNMLFSKKSMSIKLPKNTIGFVANYGRKGFYRVKYVSAFFMNMYFIEKIY